MQESLLIKRDNKISQATEILYFSLQRKLGPHWPFRDFPTTPFLSSFLLMKIKRKRVLIAIFFFMPTSSFDWSSQPTRLEFPPQDSYLDFYPSLTPYHVRGTPTITATFILSLSLSWEMMAHKQHLVFLLRKRRRRGKIGRAENDSCLRVMNYSVEWGSQPCQTPKLGTHKVWGRVTFSSLFSSCCCMLVPLNFFPRQLPQLCFLFFFLSCY